MRPAPLLALVAAVAWSAPALAQDEEPVPAAGDADEEARGTFTFDDDGAGGCILAFDDEEPEATGPEALARDLRERVARNRAAGAPDAGWYAASLVPATTPASPQGLLAALDAETARLARGLGRGEGPGGRTSRYLGFTAALCRHGPRARALLALLRTLRPGHPWLQAVEPLVLARPALDALAGRWSALDAPLAPRVTATVLGWSQRAGLAAAEPQGMAACGVLRFDDAEEEEEPAHLATGVLVTGADGGAYLVDASLRRWPLAPDAAPVAALDLRESSDPWDLLEAALRARRLGDEAGALRALVTAIAATRRADGEDLVREASRQATRSVRVSLVDDLARGAPATDVVRRLRALDALDPGHEPLTERLAGLDEPPPDAAPWSRPDWEELGVEERLDRLTRALTAVHGVVPARPPSSGGCFVFDDGRADDEEQVPAPLRPLADRWAELGWEGIGGLVALLPDDRLTRLVEAGRLVPWTVGEAAARLFVRLTGAGLEDPSDPDGRVAFGAAFWEQQGPRGPRAWYLGNLEDPEDPSPDDAGLLTLLRAQPALATAWLEARLAEADPQALVAWAALYVRAGAPLTRTLEEALRRAMRGDDRSAARDVALELATDPRFAAEREALCWRLAREGASRPSLQLLRTLPRPPEALVLAVAEALTGADRDELPAGPAKALVGARRRTHLRELRDLVLAAQLVAVRADPALTLYAVDTLRRAQEERPTLEGLVALADALDDLAPRLTPALLDQAPDLGLWLHRAYGARAASGDAAGATARDAIGAWWAGAASGVAGIDRGPCLPAPLVEPLATTFDADTLAAALGTLEEHGRFRAQVAIDAEAGRGGLQLRVELVPRPEEHAVGWWTLRVDVLGPAGELLSTTEACTGEPTARWVRPILADALAALRATPGARLVLRATPP